MQSKMEVNLLTGIKKGGNVSFFATNPASKSLLMAKLRRFEVRRLDGIIGRYLLNAGAPPRGPYILSVAKTNATLGE